MSSSGFTPFFLPGPTGRLFAIYHSLRPAADNAINFVHVPPFAEEMNRSRRMAALQARELARRGVGVLLLDLFGTGDSEGEFRDATWEAWMGDIEAAVSWLSGQGSKRNGLWGVRLGGLLAIAAACGSADIKHVILWNPVTSGRIMLKQFLRIHVAANMEGSKNGQDAKMPRARLLSGETVEVAGYAITPALATSLELAELTDFSPTPSVTVEWFELLASEELAPPPAARSTVEDWQQKGLRTSLRKLAGEPFWSLQEINVAPTLIEATSALFEPRSAER
jgi:exosortase A-associated hydrolase 2